jgi:hypothetical protein
MIGRVYRGRDTAGLLDYLYGPGRRDEHVAPHLLASWDGAPATLEPPASPERPGRYEVARLARLLDAPLRLRERPPERHVWHCALRVAEADRRLTDAEWRAVAEEVVARTGFAPRGDDGGCRWVAVRHADDRIHRTAAIRRLGPWPGRVIRSDAAAGLGGSLSRRRRPPKTGLESRKGSSQSRVTHADRNRLLARTRSGFGCTLPQGRSAVTPSTRG